LFRVAVKGSNLCFLLVVFTVMHGVAAGHRQSSPDFCLW